MHTFRHHVAYGDTSQRGALRLDALSGLLQAAAIDHASARGWGEEQLRKSASAWVLHRLSARLDVPPAYGACIEVGTWPVGLAGVRGLREYELQCDGRVIGRAAATWVFIDVVRRCPKRVPAELIASFEIEKTRGGFSETDHDLAIPAVGETPASIDMTFRASDFDSNGHVNNSVYLDLALTASERVAGVHLRPRGFVIQFLREIVRGSHVAQVGCFRKEGLVAFNIAVDGVERSRGVLFES